MLNEFIRFIREFCAEDAQDIVIYSNYRDYRTPMDGYTSIISKQDSDQGLIDLLILLFPVVTDDLGRFLVRYGKP